MPLAEADSDLFKAWVIKKLAAISDADSEVLADYVLALVKTDDSEVVARVNCIDNLKDFIGDSARSFVNDVFLAINSRSFDPSRPQSARKPSAAIYEPPKRVSYELPSLPNESRKRSYHDWDAEEGQNEQNDFGAWADRPLKQPRRGMRVGRQAHQSARGGYHAPQTYTPMQFSPMPTPPLGMPPFDPSNPMAAMMAMGQAMGFLPPTPASAIPGHGMPRSARRCRDYDQKGFCMRGADCPYEHDDNALVVPPQDIEYDPTTPASFNVTPSRVGYVSTPFSNGNSGVRSGAMMARGAPRTELSSMGMNHDKSVTSIVVEQIPEQYFTEDHVRAFFGAFGNIQSVTLRPYKSVAIVKYDDYDSAKAAYKSPDVVFGNRFVKVYWLRPDNVPQPPNGHKPADFDEDIDMEQEEEEGLDYEAIAAKQAEAQRKHDEKKKRIEEVQKNRHELNEKLAALDLERKEANEVIAKKTGKVVPSTSNGDDPEQNKILQAQLAELEREAWALGIDPAGIDHTPYMPQAAYRGRGRGYRGRFHTRGRGHYQPSYRGGGGFSGGRVTMSLDNRPKTVAVTFAEGQYQQHEEALRQYLMFNGLESATLSKHPSREDAALIAFQQRFEAENFTAAFAGGGPLAGSELPKGLGRVALTWYKGDEGTSVANGHGHAEQEIMRMDEVEVAEPIVEEQPAPREDRDMDTYDE
ncbi:hypothetical protein LTR10_006741 [Elasticomyces elasticus]|nr:hypothetical protein LTR10_006741 [Elasticomyces elasticus]